jgi:hypothetical protein
MFNALAPVFALILLGYLCKHLEFPTRAFWPEAERITYYLFLPSLFLSNLASADFSKLSAAPLAISLILAIVAACLLLLATRPLMGLPGPSFSSVFQGGVRMNTYVGLAGAAALMGQRGLTLSAVALIAMIPLLNFFCVPVVAHFGSKGSPGLRGTLRELAKNPLILACLGGFALNLGGVPLPQSLRDVLTLLGRVSLPLGLMAVGAALQFNDARAQARGVALSAAAKLALLPALTAAACVLLGVHGEERTIAVLFAALPTSSSAFILARQLGGDTALMATIVTAHTLISFATLPLALSLLG